MVIHSQVSVSITVSGKESAGSGCESLCPYPGCAKKPVSTGSVSLFELLGSLGFSREAASRGCGYKKGAQTVVETVEYQHLQGEYDSWRPWIAGVSAVAWV